MLNVEERLKELDAQIEAIYLRAYLDNRTGRLVRLDPNSGTLGALWLEWDTLMAVKEGSNGGNA